MKAINEAARITMQQVHSQVIKKVEEQESILLKTRERLHSRNINVNDSKVYQYERSKMIGMLDILDILGMDRKQFSWIF